MQFYFEPLSRVHRKLENQRSISTEALHCGMWAGLLLVAECWGKAMD